MLERMLTHSNSLTHSFSLNFNFYVTLILNIGQRITEYGYGMLEVIKAAVSESITKSLLGDDVKSEEIIDGEEYMKDEWTSIKNIEYVKYFFEKEVLTVPILIAGKKKKKKKNTHTEVKVSEEVEVSELVESVEEQVKENDKEPIEESKEELEIVKITQPVKIKEVEEIVVINANEHRIASKVHTVQNNKKKKRKGNGKQDKQTEREYKELKSRTYEYFHAPTGSISSTKKVDTNKQINKTNNIKDNPPKKETQSAFNKEEEKDSNHNELIVKNTSLKVLNTSDNISTYEIPQQDNEMEKTMKKLNVEMRRMVNQLEAYNVSLSSICESIRKAIQAQAAKAFSNEAIQAILYGSAALGLALETSDIDIILTNIEATSSEGYMQNILKLGEHFEAQSFVEECKAVTTARVPLIKLVLNLVTMGVTFSCSQIKLDITIGDQIYRPSVYYGVHFSLWVTQKLCALPDLKPLILLSKHLLAKHELNNLYYGNCL